MTNRRQFIRAGVAVSTAGVLATVLPLQGLAAAGSKRTKLPFHLAVVDQRFSDSARFGAAMSGHGVATHDIQGDVTSLWYTDLHPRWKQRAVPIAGLTTHGTLFCLERLAWDHDMRVVYRGRHQRLPNGDVEHQLQASAFVPGIVANRLSGRDSWPSEIAALIASIPSSAAPVPMNAQRTAQVTCISRCAASPTERDQALYSWAIAPRARPAAAEGTS